MGRVSKVAPPVARTRLLLEVASALVGERRQPNQLLLELRYPGDAAAALSLSSDDTAYGVEAVCRGEVTVALANPSALLTLARRGVPPFRGHAPVAVVTVVPSGDELVVAVSESTGLTSLEQAAAERYPLRVSVRGEPRNSVHLVTDHVLAASGLSLADVEAWGGSVSFDPGLPARGDRIAKAARGEIDCIIDEGSATWTDDALAAGMRVLALSAPALERLVSWGYRRASLPAERYPGLRADVATIDFSGFPIYCRDDAPDELVEALCAALVERSDRITTQSGEPIELAEMCADTAAAPFDVPMHRAAQAFWAAAGYEVGGRHGE